MKNKIVASLLGAVNDLTLVRAYGDGWLVSTPLTYSDGDTVRVYVEPYNEGFRVTDRAEATDRLSMWGVVTDSGRARRGILAVRQAANLSPIGSDATETATVGDDRSLGHLVLGVAQAALRTEQLRWLARDLPAMKFDDRLSTRIEGLSRARHWNYVRRASMTLSHGRVKQVTAAVEGPEGKAYIQAVSNADVERSTINCFYLFDRSTELRDHKVAALAGDSGDWPDSLLGDLHEVSVVTFFADPHGLENELERITGGLAPVL